MALCRTIKITGYVEIREETGGETNIYLFGFSKRLFDREQ